MPRRNFRRKNPRRLRKRRQGMRRRHPKMDRIQSLTVRAPGAIVPDRLKCKLLFNNTLSYRFYAPATGVNGYRYRMNSAWDVDPLSLSTAVAGFLELSALYSRYRVHGSSWKLMCINREAFPVIVGTTPLNNDPGAAITLSQAQDLLMNPYTKSRTLSGTGGMDRAMIKGFISTRKIVGSNTAQLDDTYSAIVTGNPANVTFLATYAYTIDGSIFVNGVDFIYMQTLYVEFYERNYVAS